MISTTYDGGSHSEDVVLTNAVGATVLSVTTNDLVEVVTTKGTLRFFHEQDCCERVYLESPAGDDLAGLVGGVVVVCEARSSDGVAPPDGSTKNDSYTWTFYELRTTRGDVTLRFLGESNGYYSEGVDVSFTPVEIDRAGGE